MMEVDICIFSYNSRGFDITKQDVLKSLLSVSGSNSTIICNQENFLLKANGYIADKCLPEHHIFFKPATKTGLNGRPKNGMFIAVPSYMKESVTDVSPLSSRIQCLLIETVGDKILLLNTYFPTDPKCDEFDESDLLTTLSEINTALMNHNFDRLVWAGDINADFKRNTRFVKIVDEFICELDIRKSWDSYNVDFTHCHELNGMLHVSTIDHFIWNSTAVDSILDAGVLHLSENLSDHSPVYCKVKSVVERKQSTSIDYVKTLQRPSWKNATESDKELYCNNLCTRLNNISMPPCLTNCTNVHCTDEEHKTALDDLMIEVLLSIEDVAKAHIPTPNISNKKSTCIPNWNSEIKCFKEKAQFWRAVWLSAGKPQNGQLHMLMKKTRNIYHLQIRKMKRIQNRVKRNALLNSCLNNNGDLFKEIRKQRRCNKVITTSIDGCKEDIPTYFANKYEKLYNGVDDRDNLVMIQEHLRKNINRDDLEGVDIIIPKLVVEAIKRLKPGKSDPLLKVTSDFFINAPDILHELLSVILKSFIIHAHVSDFLLLSSLVPIVKDKLASITNSNNYRSIAISSIVLKIFDWVIIIGFKDYLSFDDLQFGYQPNVSTSMCTWLAVETISYFSRNGSDIFTCLMDMSKAFDNVQHSILFNKLLDKGLPYIIVRFILTTYHLQQANVKWNDEFSQFFSISNGVKQGAVISAVFYCIYTNELLEELRRRNIGCCIGQNYVGVVGYADDLFLMCPTLDGLQKMLNVCEKFASDHNLRFSTDPDPEKSKTK